MKLWPNVAPDAKYDSSTPGKLEPIHPQDQILANYSNKPTNSNLSTPATKHPYTATPPVIKWDDEGEYPMSDELSRISKVCSSTCSSQQKESFFQLIKTQGDGHTIHQDWLEQLKLAKARSCLDKERTNSKSMLLMVEFSRTMMDDNECVVLYYEPVRSGSRFSMLVETSRFFQNCEDVLNYAVGYNELVVDDPELDLVRREQSRTKGNLLIFRRTSSKANI